MLERISERPWVVGLLLAAATMATFAPTLGNEFILDDEYIVVDNPAIRELSHVPGFFVTTPPGGVNSNYYRPITLTVFAIEFAAFGLDARAFHAAGIAFHVAVTLLVFWILRRLVGRAVESLLAALLFAVHPIQGESVYLVNYQAVLLSAAFFFAAFHHHVRHQGQWTPSRVAVLGVLFFASLAAKEAGVALPLVLALHDLLVPVPPRALPGSDSRWQRWLPYLACLVAALIYLLARALLCTPSSVSYFGDAPWSHVIATMTVLEAHALSLVLVPRDLAGTYDAVLPASLSLLHPAFWLAVAMLAGLLWVAHRLRRRAPLITFGIVFWFVTLAPTYHLIKLPILFGERFLYIPLFGACLVTAHLLSGVRRERLSMFARGGLLTACLLCAWQTHARAADWRNPETFWKATVRERPTSVQAHVGLARTLRAQRRCQEALPHYRFALQRVGVSRADRPLHGETASCLSISGDRDAARAVVRRWLSAHPRDTVFQEMLRRLDAAHAPTP